MSRMLAAFKSLVADVDSKEEFHGEASLTLQFRAGKLITITPVISQTIRVEEPPPSV